VLENVIGFESSQSCQKWRSVLKARNYHIGHLHLTPTQVLIPNDRPRYYCIAILQSSSLGHRAPNGSSSLSMTEDESAALNSWFASKEDSANDEGDDVHAPLTTSRNIHTNIDPLGVMDKEEDNNGQHGNCKPISQFLDSIDTNNTVPDRNDNENVNRHDKAIPINDGNGADSSNIDTSLFVAQKNIEEQRLLVFRYSNALRSTQCLLYPFLWPIHPRYRQCPVSR